MILDTLEDLRRTAYVNAVMSDNVVGWVGARVPVEVFEALGLTVYPLYGIDAEILEYSSGKDMCPIIDATITYAKTDKCPLIHSSKLIVADDTCRAMLAALSRLPDKHIHVYADTEGLLAVLQDVYGTGGLLPEKLSAVREERTRIRRRIQSLTNDPLEGFIIGYYMNFLDIWERMSFLDGIAGRELGVSHKFVETIYHCPECRGKFEGGVNYGRLSCNVGSLRDGRKDS